MKGAGFSEPHPAPRHQEELLAKSARTHQARLLRNGSELQLNLGRNKVLGLMTPRLFRLSYRQLSSPMEQKEKRVFHEMDGVD
jgi:hypothetical protein